MPACCNYSENRCQLQHRRHIASVTRTVDARLNVNLVLEYNSLQATRQLDKQIHSTSTVPLLNERWTKWEHHTRC